MVWIDQVKIVPLTLLTTISLYTVYITSVKWKKVISVFVLIMIVIYMILKTKNYF